MIGLDLFEARSSNEQQRAQDQAGLMPIATGGLGRKATILQLNIVWNADSPCSSTDEAGRVATR